MDAVKICCQYMTKNENCLTKCQSEIAQLFQAERGAIRNRVERHDKTNPAVELELLFALLNEFMFFSALPML